MSSYVETLSITELNSRKIFLENQLKIVNNLIENYELNNSIENNISTNYEIFEEDEVKSSHKNNTNEKNIVKKKIKLKIKPSSINT